MALSQSDVTTPEVKKHEESDPRLDINLPLNRLAAQLAHDLNLPLASILAYAEELVDLAKERYGMEGFMQIVKYIEIIQSEANHCREIVDKMLQYAKGLEIQLEIVDVHKLLSDCVEKIGHRFKDQTIHFETDFDPRVTNISTDPSGLRQVVMNVLSNSCFSLGDSGRIDLRTKMQNDAVLIEIADNGAGIEQEVLDKIFDPFFTTKSAGEGTGLGLAICQGILQTLKGKIMVDSQKNQGTTIKIWMPKKFKVILT